MADGDIFSIGEAARLAGVIICTGCKKEKPIVAELDGDRFCQQCANNWVRGEGDHVCYLEEQEREHCQDAFGVE